MALGEFLTNVHKMNNLLSFCHSLYAFSKAILFILPEYFLNKILLQFFQNLM
jgi:hypothetical protein